jgi:hypothetical protein
LSKNAARIFVSKWGLLQYPRSSTLAPWSFIEIDECRFKWVAVSGDGARLRLM